MIFDKGITVRVVITATTSEGVTTEVMSCTQADTGEAMRVDMKIADDYETIAVMAMAAAASSIARRGEPCDCPTCTGRRAEAVAAGVPKHVAERAKLH